MSKIDNIIDISNIIFDIEKEYDLFNRQINGIYFWKLIRFGLWRELTEKLGFLDIAHTKKEANIVKDIIFSLKDSIIYNNSKSVDVIIFAHDRYYYEEGYRDIHTDYLYSNLEKKENIVTIYPPFTEKKYRNREFYINEDLSYFISRFQMILNKQKKGYLFSEKEIELLDKIKSYFKELTGLEHIAILDKDTIKHRLVYFKIEYIRYYNLFKKKSPKKIYIVCSYGKEALIHAAQCLDIEVIEVQHGFMNNYHLGYSFYCDNIPYFPNKLQLYGEYWKDITNLPNNCEIIYQGYPYLEKQMDKYFDLKEKSNQVLFISQGTIGKNLSEKAIEYALENPDLNVIFRLHPGEFSRWKKEYKLLYDNRDLPNLIVSDNNEINLYEYLMTSQYVICVDSTVIYEALELGKKVYIIKLPGFERVGDLIEKNYVSVIDVDEKISFDRMRTIIKIKPGYIFKLSK